jgi:serine/threonine protein kinase
MQYAAPLAVRPVPDSIQAAFSEPATLSQQLQLEPGPREATRVVELGVWLCDALEAMQSREFLPRRELNEEVAKYMSPEQVCGLACDVRSDLYSIGCMLFEAAEGRAPFVGSLDDVVLNHVMVVAPRVRSMPRAVAAVIERLLAKEPADRFQSIDELRRALTEMA